VLLETFVEKVRFTGTCYQAANWIWVGVTKGRGKLDRYNLCSLPVKTFIYFRFIRISANFSSLFDLPFMLVH
jgi:hypothetical protein